MTLCLKYVSSKCLSLKPPFSIVKDFFGLKFIFPERKMSLKRQLKLISCPGIDLNIIILWGLGFESSNLKKISYAIQCARDVFANVDLCIRKISWYNKSDQPEAKEYESIDMNADGTGKKHRELTHKFKSPNNSLDIFIIKSLSYGIFAGYSPVDGPCNKEDNINMTGCIISLAYFNENELGCALAHEIGHFLGLHDYLPGQYPGNFMTQSKYPVYDITPAQGDRIKLHCYVKKFS